MLQKTEGVTKFRRIFIEGQPIDAERARKLNEWRALLYAAGLVGQDETRYNGDGYGNLSHRIEPYEMQRNRRAFIVTGSQTGYLPTLGREHFVNVIGCYPERNIVVQVRGQANASSESMSHEAVYNADDSCRAVFHVHSPQIWNCSGNLQIPATRETVECGTPEMAEEIERLFKDTDVAERRILTMGGHEDGIITFGRTLDEAGLNMMKYLSLASSS